MISNINIVNVNLKAVGAISNGGQEGSAFIPRHSEAYINAFNL